MNSLWKALGPPARPAGLVLCALGIATAVAALGARGQQGTFRAAVDVIAVDVQVVDSKGVPVAKLGIPDFEVSIDGRRRRILSADFIRQTSGDGMGAVRPVTSGPVASNSFPGAGSTSGRVIMLAVDVGSLSAGTSREVMAATRGFLAQLPAGDLVGLYSFPLGPRLVPTADHAAIGRALDTVIGSNAPIRSEFNLRPSEVVDITAEVASSMPTTTVPGGTTPSRGTMSDVGPSETIRRVQQRESCMDARCATRIRMEATSAAFELEARVNQSVDGLRTLLQGLSLLPGRKTLVLLSGGMVVSDRPGGRPDVSGLEKALGQEVAQANTAVYTVHFDTHHFAAFSTENARGDRMPSNRERDGSLIGRWLEMFSGASGGALLKVTVGSGEAAFERVLRETSAYYLLGVEPEQADRDGRTRQLRVKVNQRGVTLRSRTWVALPKK